MVTATRREIKSMVGNISGLPLVKVDYYDDDEFIAREAYYGEQSDIGFIDELNKLDAKYNYYEITRW
jgi:hypothetical protein